MHIGGYKKKFSHVEMVKMLLRFSFVKKQVWPKVQDWQIRARVAMAADVTRTPNQWVLVAFCSAMVDYLSAYFLSVLGHGVILSLTFWNLVSLAIFRTKKIKKYWLNFNETSGQPTFWPIVTSNFVFKNKK